MKILIIEDEIAATRRLTKLILEIAPQCEIVGELDSIETSVEWFQSNPQPDLIFQDIQLADGSSFEIFKSVEIFKPIIFTTAFDQYAIQAFKVNAIDYILKPIKRESLEMALEKYHRWQGDYRFDYKALVKAIRRDEYNHRFLIKFGQQIKVVEISEVAYFYTQSKITFLVTSLGKRYPIDYSLDKLDALINPTHFFRINRQFIINISAIKEMYSYSKSRVKIELHPACDIPTIVSTERSPNFKNWLVGKSS